MLTFLARCTLVLAWGLGSGAVAQAQIEWFSKDGISHVLALGYATGDQPAELNCTVTMVNEPPAPFCPWCQQQLSLCERDTNGISAFNHTESAAGATSNTLVTSSMHATGSLDAEFGGYSAHINGVSETVFQKTGEWGATNGGIGRTSGEVHFRIPEGRSLTLDSKGTLDWTPGLISNRGSFQLYATPNTGADLGVNIGANFPLPDTGTLLVERQATLTAGAYTLVFHTENNVAAASGRVALDLQLTFTPWTCDEGKEDSDGDALPDVWENVGVRLPNGNCVPREYVFDGDGDTRLDPSEMPDPFRKDLYVEVDWMPGQEYAMAAFTPVVYAFARSPVTNPDPLDPVGGVDAGRRGIALHVQLGEEAQGFANSKICMAGQEWLKPYQDDPPDCADVSFAAVRAKYFMPATYHDPQRPPRGRTHYWPTLDEIRQAREMVYRYTLLGEEIDETPTHGGLALPSSNDIAVAPGSVKFLTFLQLDPLSALKKGSLAALLVNDDGSGLQNMGLQCSTYNKLSYSFMHELGHTLGLQHGGGDNVNNKPNYMSVMNYAYISQFCGTLAPRLDYSGWVSAPLLLERVLNEEHGLDGPLSPEMAEYLRGRETVFGQALTVEEFAKRTQGVTLPNFAPPWNSNCVAWNPQIRKGGLLEPDRLPTSVARADGPIDWNQNCRIDSVRVRADINAEFTDGGEEPENADEQLVGWDDWGRLDFNFRDDPYYSGGLYKAP